MKFLIEKKPKIIKTLDGFFFIAGNNLFTRLANKYNFVRKTFSYKGKLAYILSNDDFYELIDVYNKRMKKRKKKFFSREPLIQFIILLKYISKRIKIIPSIKREKNKEKAYSDIYFFLEKAINILDKNKYSFLKYGYFQNDIMIYRKYLYLFKIKDDLYAFYLPKLLENIPKFPFEINGIEVTLEREKLLKFPFKIRKIKKLI